MILWLMVMSQLIAWGWFTIKGGKLSDKKFLIFTCAMLIGQLGTGIETFYAGAQRTLLVQGYFFLFTAIGGIQRLRQMMKRKE